MTCAAAALLVAGITLPCPAPACSLCDSSLRAQNTFREDMAQAKIVLYGTIANPQFNKKPGAPPGSGTTEFHVLRPLKDDPARAGRKQMELSKYLPVPDPKNPPALVVFFDLKDGQLNPYHGRFVKSEAVLPYLAGVLEFQAKDRTQQLQFYFKYLDDADSVISHDAYLEFARCSDEEVGSIAKHLPADKLKALLQDPKTPTERLGLYAFLLGASGSGKEAAALLRGMIEQPTNRTESALDGLLGGYIHLQPREGWDLAAAILANPKKPLTQRFAVARTLRFYHAWKPAESKQEIERCLAVMLPDGDIADIAIDDLRQWKMWDLTQQVLAQFGKPSHDSPLARRGIVRYALCCPQPAAQQFIARLRQQDPDLVRDVEESLEFDKGK
jgi:hypothetical protein